MDLIKAIQPIISLVISFATLVGLVIAFYKFSSDPDARNSEDIKLIQQNCLLKSKTVDDKFNEIELAVSGIKDNHLAHIEKDVRDLAIKQERIFTILEERLPKK